MLISLVMKEWYSYDFGLVPYKKAYNVRNVANISMKGKQCVKKKKAEIKIYLLDDYFSSRTLISHLQSVSKCVIDLLSPIPSPM